MNEQTFRQWLSERLQRFSAVSIGRELGVGHSSVVRWRTGENGVGGPVLKLAGLIAAMERDQTPGIPIRKRKSKSKP